MLSLLKLLISNRMCFYLVLLVLITYIFILLLYVQRRSTSQSKRKKMNYNRAIDYYCATAKNRLLSHNDNYISPNIKFRLYIIVHNSFSQEIAEKWSNCMPFVTIIRIPTTFFFESIVYQRSLYTLRDEWKHLDLVGLATYKSLKFSPLEKLKAYIELAYYKPYDVVPLYSAGEQLMDQAVAGHTKEFQIQWYETLTAMGFTIQEISSLEKVEVFLRNSFIATPRALEGLIAFMNRSIAIASENQMLKTRLSTNAHYREAKKVVARAVFDADVYFWHPFIFERLPVFYFHYYNFSVFQTLREYALFSNAQVDGLFEGI